MTLKEDNKEKPLLLMDIDGVLNLFDAWIDGGFDFSGRSVKVKRVAPEHLREVVVGGYRLLLNPDHIEMFEALEEHFDVVWATMWQSGAFRFGKVAGFGEHWDWIPFDDFHKNNSLVGRIGRGVGHHKDPGIKAVLGDQPGVWVDDDMQPDQREWAQKRTEAGIPTLFIQPDPEFGMTWEHYHQILEFLDNLDADSMVA